MKHGVKIRIFRWHQNNKRSNTKEQPCNISIESLPTADKTAEPEEELTKEDIRALKTLAVDFERTLDYYYLRNKPWRNIALGLVNGMARGLGFAIGLTVLAFILISIIRSLNLLDIPVIGDFLADLLVYIDEVHGLSR